MYRNKQIAVGLVCLVGTLLQGEESVVTAGVNHLHILHFVGNQFTKFQCHVQVHRLFVYLLTKVEAILEFARSFESFIPVDGRYIGMLIKMIGITYVAEFATNICKDAGYAAIGSQIEIFAKISILMVSIPVLGTFLEMIRSYL